MNELQRATVTQDRGSRQRVGGLPGDVDVELRERGRVAQLGTRAEHRHGERELAGGRTEPSQPRQRGTRDRPWRDLLDARSRRVVRDDTVDLERTHELPEQERVASGRTMTGPRERQRARAAEQLCDQRRRRRLAERLRTQHLEFHSS